jgi:hypothetical protein
MARKRLGGNHNFKTYHPFGTNLATFKNVNRISYLKKRKRGKSIDIPIPDCYIEGNG